MNTITITITVDMTPENLEILKQLCSQPAEQPIEQPAKKTRKKKAEAPAPVEEAPAEKPEPPKEETMAEESAKKYTTLDVKAVCLKLSKAGKQDLLRATFAKFGGKKLSDIKPEDYPALMDELAAGGAENA